MSGGSRERWWRGGRWALPLLVVVPMLAVAGAAGRDGLVFPEGAALAMGIWVLGDPGWSASRGRILVLPPLCAAAGVLLARSGLPVWGAELAALTFALLALAALDSRLAPALSAALLPIVFDMGDWAYPLTVTAVCALIVAGMPWLVRAAGPARRGAPTGRYPAPVAAAAWLVVATWILLGGQLLPLSSAALAPPLFVSALEWLGRGSRTLAAAVRRLVLLTGAGLAGAAAAAVVDPAWLAGALAVVATLGLMRLLGTPHPPALAIALLPLILERPEPLAFALAIAAGAAALYLGALAVAARGRL